MFTDEQYATMAYELLLACTVARPDLRLSDGEAELLEAVNRSCGLSRSRARLLLADLDNDESEVPPQNLLYHRWDLLLARRPLEPADLASFRLWYQRQAVFVATSLMLYIRSGAPSHTP